MIKPFKGIAVNLRRLSTDVLTGTWTVAVDCLQSDHKKSSMTHSTTACHIFGWQPGSSLSRNIKFCYLAILFWAIPRSLCGPNQCPLFSSFWNTLQRHECRMEARVLAKAKKADVLRRPFPVGTGLEEVFTQPGEWKDWGLLPGPSGKQGTPWLELTSTWMPTRRPQRAEEGSHSTRVTLAVTVAETLQCADASLQYHKVDWIEPTETNDFVFWVKIITHT